MPVTAEQLAAWLSEGADDATKATIASIVSKDAMKQRLSGLRTSDEVSSLEQELNGMGDKPGAKAYRDWYAANYPAITQMQQKLADAEARLAGGNPQPQPGGKMMTPDEVKQMIADSYRNEYAPRVANTLRDTTSLVERHVRSGRAVSLDMDAVTKLAAEKYAGNLSLAYDEWDKPEKEKADKARYEKEFASKVEEEVSKRLAGTRVPGGGLDYTPGGMSPLPRAAAESFDRVGRLDKLAAEWEAAGIVQ